LGHVSLRRWCSPAAREKLRIKQKQKELLEKEDQIDQDFSP